MNDKDALTTGNTEDSAEKPLFDVKAAERERLDWKLGGEAPTERALGLQENLNRRVSDEIKEKLGENASKDMEPEQ
jgi:hypothetical protein